MTTLGNAPSLDRRPIVVTGIGAVSGFGWGAESLWNGLLGIETSIDLITRFDPSPHRTKVAAEVPDALPAGRSVPDRRSAADRFALHAAAEAIDDARLGDGWNAAAGVFFGSSTGGMLESEWFYAHVLDADRGRAPISWLASQQYCGPGDAVARRWEVTGPVETVSSACTSGALAVLAARDALVSGEVDIALAGGADSLCELTHAGFNALRAVDPRPCRPFRADRAGMSIGEGAAVLVLETAEGARRREARILAHVAGGGSSCDAHHMTAPAPDGGGAARAIRQALDEAGVAPRDVGFVNVHGTGTPLNDAAEWSALTTVFGEHARELPLTAPKGHLGHLLGAAGAIEAVATVRSLVEGLVPPTAGEPPVDPEMGARLVLGEPLALETGKLAMSLNLAFGGSNSALLFRPARSDGRGRADE